MQYQRGLPDHISHDAHLLATKFLLTVTETIQRDRERIKLPDRMLDEVRAEAHRWVGDLEARRGNAAAARSHLLKSLRYRPWQPRVMAMLFENCVPSGARGGLRATFRALLRNWRRATAGAPRALPGVAADQPVGAGRG
jgi:hypothetical protein